MKKGSPREPEWKGLSEEEKAHNLLEGLEVPSFVFDMIEEFEKPVLGPDEEVLGLEPDEIRRQRIGFVHAAVRLKFISKKLGERILAAFLKAAPEKGGKAMPGRKP